MHWETKTFVWLALLRYPLNFGGLEPNLQGLSVLRKGNTSGKKGIVADLNSGLRLFNICPQTVHLSITLMEKMVLCMFL